MYLKLVSESERIVESTFVVDGCIPRFTNLGTMVELMNFPRLYRPARTLLFNK